MLSALLSVLGTALAVVMVGLVAWTSHAVAACLLPGARPHVRVAAAAVVAVWSMLVWFFLLASLELFSLPAVLAVHAVGGVLLYRRRRNRLEEALRCDLAAVAAWARRWLRGPALLVAAPLLALVVLRQLRALAAPPLGWDALTYHLLRAGRWVQTGGFAYEDAPDAWRAYEHFPPGGDILWAHAMLATHGDQWIGVAGLVAWVLWILGAYLLARALRAGASAALATALALGAIPAVLAFSTSAYVDTFAAALVLLGLGFLARALASLDRADAWLAMAALSAATCVKITAAPVLGLAVVAIAVAWTIDPNARTRLGSLVLGGCAAALAFVPYYARTTAQTGCPTFPWDLRIAGRTVCEGLEVTRLALSGALVPPLDDTPDRFVALLFWETKPDWPHLNLGLGMPILLVLGLAAVPRALRSRSTAVVCAAVLLYAGTTALSITGDAMVAQRTLWGPVVGRLLVMGLAPLAVVGALVAGTGAAWLRGLALLIGVWHCRPLGWSTLDVQATAVCAAMLFPALALPWLARRQPWSRRAAWAVAAAVVALIPIQALRDSLRYRYYQRSTDAFDHGYDPHPLGPAVFGWPIWALLDDGEPHTVVATAGWFGLGDNWYRYPLMGSRLQNRVLYVPITRSGEVVDYRTPERLTGKADPRAWLTRLIEAEVDHVVSIAPPTPERAWMLAQPEIFRLVAHGGEFDLLFGFDPAAARRLLDATPLVPTAEVQP